MGGEFPSALPMALFQLLWAGEASLSPCSAPKCPFRTFRCFAWLIHDFAPSPMRALVFRSAYSASRNARASAAFAASIKAHCAVGTETLMLQVRFAHPPSTHRNAPSEHSGVPHGLLGSESTPCSLIPNAHAPGSLRSPFGAAPNRLFELLRCSQWAGEASLPPAPLSPTTRALRDGRTLRNVCHDGLKKCPSFIRSNPSVPLRLPPLYFPNSISCNSLCACVTSPLQPCCFSPSRLA